ncbi:MAG: hypothetical protein KKE44_10300 [Proteobacteria bacterium]|nr:hypothetical protein [Pseudomonadota bacterium]MBU1583114.1 hypothetical protein [Pseudomonadota bacterium]MBU2455687.1 hypothetical protein [Pseudomonadota bacterium]MBU2628688.1 hypothetical protein [Pseudomonadota bacterium]
MHDGCSAAFTSGKQIVDKIRMMGFHRNPLGIPFEISCTNCEAVFQMAYMESQCPACGMVYGVTPCHSHRAEFVKPAGVNY